MESNENNHIVLRAHIDTSELDNVTKKVEHLNELLEKASSLAGELAFKEIKLSVEVES